MENLTPVALVTAAVIAALEVAKAGMRLAARKINGHTDSGVHKSDLEALRHEISRDVAQSASGIKSYIQEEFREFGERMARIEQRVDDGEKR